jgi:hypothetical protein
MGSDLGAAQGMIQGGPPTLARANRLFLSVVKKFCTRRNSDRWLAEMRALVASTAFGHHQIPQRQHLTCADQAVFLCQTLLKHLFPSQSEGQFPPRLHPG